MAEEWIKMRKKLLKEEEVREMAIRLKVTRQHVCGCLLAVWGLADEHATERIDPLYQADKCPPPSGTPAGTDDGTDVVPTEGFLRWSTLADIDHEADQAGFGEAMQGVRWLRVYEDGIGIPQYQIHNASSAKKRASEAKKKAKQRLKKQHCPDPRPANVPATGGQKRGPEEEGEGDKNKNQRQRQRSETEGGGGGKGSRQTSPPSGSSGPVVPAATAAEAEAEEFFGEWDGISGVSQEHAAISDERLEIDPQIRKLVTARMLDPHFANNWRTGLNFVRTSDLCRGMVPPKEGFQESWRGSVKWFCGVGELTRILAGKFGGNGEGVTEEEEDRLWAESRERGAAQEVES